LNQRKPVCLSVGYSVSELKGAVTALGLTYTGPVVVSASYQTTNHPGTSSKLSTMYTVGAGYTMGDMTIKANYLNGVNTTVAGADTNEAGIFGIGLDWKTSSANTVLIAYYHGNDDKVNDSTTNTFVVANEYALSKRTTLYGQLAFANADSAADLRTSVVAGGTQAGKTTSLLNVGIKHSF
jgi:predicted porin